METLRDLRHRRGMTMQQAADAVGYAHRTSWAFIESGSGLPSLNRMQAMAEALGVSLEQLHEAIKATKQQARRRKGNGARRN